MDASYFLSVAVAATTLHGRLQHASPSRRAQSTRPHGLFSESDCGVSPPLVPCRLDRDRQRGGPAYCCRASKGGCTKPAGLCAVNRKMGKLTPSQKLMAGGGGSPQAPPAPTSP